MNKAEIIRRISKKAGVPDTEAKKFFEIFLKNAADLLKPGESLNIPNIGLFQLRVGQIENRTTQDTGDKYIYSDLVVFINPESEEEKEGEEEIIFNVPSGIEEASQPVDSYFSLSIGKPIIPLTGVGNTEFFIPPSGTELISLIDSKMERLLEEAEKVEGGKETETIHLKTAAQGADEPPESGTPTMEDTIEEIEVPSRSDFMKTREFENLSWDFGENLSQEIEDEAVSGNALEEEETDHERELIINEPEKEADGQTESEILFEEEILDEETHDEDMFEEIIEDDDELEEEIFEFTEGEVIKSETDSIIEDTEEETSEIPAREEKVQEREILIPGDTDNEQDIPNIKPRPEETALKNFQRVKSLTKEFDATEFNITGEIEEERPKKITEVRGGYQKVRRTTAEFDFDLSGIKGLDEIEEELPPPKKDHVPRDYQGYRKQSRVPSLIVAFIVVIALGIVIFLYMKMKSANHETSAGYKSAVTKQETTVIERDYDIPVTYPYEKSDKESKTDTKQNLNDQAEKKADSLSTAVPVKKNTTDLSVIRNPFNAKRIGSYIYQYPEGIVVQVSSWKSKSIAVNEVNRYRNAGYSAFAEMSLIPAKGLYYKVRVGYFGSLAEAENFLNGNQ